MNNHIPDDIHRVSLQWDFVQRSALGTTHLPFAFKKWHSASKVGMDLQRVFLRDRDLTDAELERLNLWVSSGGAWRASLLSPWDGAQLLTKVISIDGVVTPIGSAGAGRIAGRDLL